MVVDTSLIALRIKTYASLMRTIINRPKTAKAGNLLHLKTLFEVNMEETNFPELPTVMLDLLHPMMSQECLKKKL